MRIEESQSAAAVRPLLEQWLAICHGDRFGIAISVAGVEKDLQARLDFGDGVLLLGYDGLELVGFFAVFSTKSSLSEQQVAVETFWFAVPNKRMAGYILFNAAKRWAKQKGCTHLLVSASRLASDLHDKVAQFCEKAGMRAFETTYVMEID